MEKMEENKKTPSTVNIELPVISDSKTCLSPLRTGRESAATPPSPDQPFVVASLRSAAGIVPKVSSQLTRFDRWGTVRARLNIGRMTYAIDPGLYALGEPDHASPVLVSANYKMSFDRLREALPGRSAWILVLDTRGINVWCAAGKGTFGTEELINRIEVSGLKSVVSHRKIILPQLGAPGVAAHHIRQLTGFKVHYGPVRADDLPAYLDAGLKASDEMRLITFPLKERAVLIPVELTAAVKPFLIVSAIFLVLAAVLGPNGFTMNLVHEGLFAVAATACAVIGGAVMIPLLLPWIPGRAFSIKGLTIGLILCLGLMSLRGISLQSWSGKTEVLAWVLIIPAITAYLAMNFTGCSTYTSLSGVKKEMRFALPLQISAAGLGLVVWISSFILAWK